MGNDWLVTALALGAAAAYAVSSSLSTSALDECPTPGPRTGVR